MYPEVRAMGDKPDNSESRNVDALSVLWLIVTVLMAVAFATGVSLLI
jgi:hypothetical protein